MIRRVAEIASEKWEQAPMVPISSSMRASAASCMNRCL